MDYIRAELSEQTHETRLYTCDSEEATTSYNNGGSSKDLYVKLVPH